MMIRDKVTKKIGRGTDRRVSQVPNDKITKKVGRGTDRRVSQVPNDKITKKVGRETYGRVPQARNNKIDEIVAVKKLEEDTHELEEGEICDYQEDDVDDGRSNIDPDIAFSYLDEKIKSVLGHFQKDFEGEVLSAEKLGPRFGGYGTFLPTRQRSPSITSRPKSPPHTPRTGIQTQKSAPKSPKSAACVTKILSSFTAGMGPRISPRDDKFLKLVRNPAGSMQGGDSESRRRHSINKFKSNRKSKVCQVNGNIRKPDLLEKSSGEISAKKRNVKKQQDSPNNVEAQQNDMPVKKKSIDSGCRKNKKPRVSQINVCGKEFSRKEMMTKEVGQETYGRGLKALNSKTSEVDAINKLEEDTKLQQGEICEYKEKDDNDGRSNVDPVIALAYLDEAIESLPGHFRKDFGGVVVSTEKPGSRFGCFGTFLPTHLRSPSMTSRPRSPTPLPPRIQTQKSPPKSPKSAGSRLSNDSDGRRRRFIIKFKNKKKSKLSQINENIGNRDPLEKLSGEIYAAKRNLEKRQDCPHNAETLQNDMPVKEKDDDDVRSNSDPSIALAYFDEKIESLPSDFQKDFEGGVVTAEKLGTRFGCYGTILPTHQLSPSIMSRPTICSPLTPGIKTQKSAPKSPKSADCVPPLLLSHTVVSRRHSMNKFESNKKSKVSKVDRNTGNCDLLEKPSGKKSTKKRNLKKQQDSPNNAETLQNDMPAKEERSDSGCRRNKKPRVSHINGGGKDFSRKDMPTKEVGRKTYGRGLQALNNKIDEIVPTKKHEEDAELEEGEICDYKEKDIYVGGSNIDHGIALTYLDEKIERLLGHFQKDFEGGVVSADKLGPRFGCYGTFLSTHQRSPPITCGQNLIPIVEIC